MLEQQKPTAGKATDLQFETRTCTNGGCGKTFRVLTTSKQDVCGATCPQTSPAKMKEFYAKSMFAGGKSEAAHIEHKIKMREQRMQTSAQKPEPVIEAKPPEPVVDFVAELEKPKPKIVIELEEPAPEPKLTKKQQTEIQVKRWETYVERAKKVVKRMSKDRMEIARLAIEACDIHHGGGDHWKGYEGVYTLHKFAEDIGVHYKTLHNWVMVKREIKDHLSPGVWDEANWGAALRTRNKINKKTTKKRVEEIYRKERSRKGSGITFHTMVKRLSDARHYMVTRIDLEAIDEEDLDKMKGICKDILDAIKFRAVKDLNVTKEKKTAKRA